MIIPDLAAAYARVTDLYRRQLALLDAEEVDFSALAELANAVDGELALLPPSDRLPVLDRADADRLIAAAREADSLRARAAARLGGRRAEVASEGAQGERAASAVRAYQPAPTSADARFLDQKR